MVFERVSAEQSKENIIFDFESENRLPRKVVDAQSLDLLKFKLDEVLGNLVHWKMFLPIAGEMD